MTKPHARRFASAFVVLLLWLPALGSPAFAAADDASASDVASGLRRIQGIADRVAETAGTDPAEAEQLLDGIEPEWEKVEGTVKANDKDAYVKLEDNFTLLKIGAKAGDATKATTASANIASALSGYLDQHPGSPAAAPTDVPSPASARSAAAADPAPASPLPRTGPPSSSPLMALAGTALGFGGLATIGGARRPSSLSRRRAAARPA